MDMRVVASCLALISLAACQMLDGNPPPISADRWHLEGSSNALLQTSDGGDFGDEDTLQGTVQAGKFLNENLLLEGLVGLGISDSETGGVDIDTTEIDMAAGARYYFDTVSARRPYVGGLIGFRHVDLDVDGGTNDDDVAPLLQLRGGIEMFMSAEVALDFGLKFEHVNELDLGGSEDDINSLGAFVGISVWL